MGNLLTLLEEIKAGKIPEGTLYKRKRGIKRTTRTRTQIRIAPVDAALVAVKVGLDEAGGYEVSGSPKEVTLTPDQYKEAKEPFQPYLETLNEAQIVVSSIKHGRIKYGRHIDDREVDGGYVIKLPIKPWPKHRKTPHMERIIALKRRLYNTLQIVEQGYQRWQSKNQRMKTEISDEISKLEKSAKATKEGYNRLNQTYKALQQGMNEPSDSWYETAAQTLGCDASLNVILTTLEQSEQSLKRDIREVKEGSKPIREKLEVQIETLETGDYILTTEDIGSESGQGLQGRLEEALAQIEWYKEPKRALFEDGVTPASPQKSGMIKVLNAAITIEEITNNAAIFKSQYEQLIGDLNQDHFLGRYALDFNPNTEREKVETKFADIKYYEKLKEYYLGKLGGLDELKTRAQKAYEAGCDKLRQEATRYLGITRVELEEVETTKRGIENLCNQIEAARKFSYGGIIATAVIDDDMLEQLQDFRDILIRAQTRLASIPTGDLRLFDSYYRSARINRDWGVHDYRFRSAVEYVRRYANRILQNADPQTEQPLIDSRVDHLFQQQVRTSHIPNEKLEQLETWEAEIQATNY